MTMINKALMMMMMTITKGMATMSVMTINKMEPRSSRWTTNYFCKDHLDGQLTTFFQESIPLYLLLGLQRKP